MTKSTLFSSVHRIFPRTYRTLGHKSSHNKFKGTEIISNIFSDHSGMKLETSHTKKIRKFMNRWRLNNMILKNQWVKEEERRNQK